MKISVVIVNYNYSSFVSSAIQSVMDQSHPADQVIVIDDGSNDNSVEVITSFLKHPTIELHEQKNSGQLAAIRAGINRVKGDWAFLLDSDDEWRTDHLEQAHAFILGNPDVALYFSNHQETSGKPIFRSKWPAGKFGPCSGLVAANGTRMGTISSTLGLRADVARDALSFDCSIDQKWRMRAEDCLIFGASLSGVIAYYNSVPTVRYRIHSDNSFAKMVHTKDSAEYLSNKSEIFTYWFERRGINLGSLSDLVSQEYSDHEHNRLNPVIRRRSRRLIKSLSGNGILNRLKKMISTSKG
jgi:glycosyltransferase involved in cell wall biosynthesis